MFQLKFYLQRNKFITSFLGITLIIAVLLLIYRYTAIESLIDQETRANTALTTVFANIIENKYSDFIEQSSRYNNYTQAVPAAVISMREDIFRHMKGLNVIRVKIYNLNGATVFSTDLRQIGENRYSNPGFISARKGNPASTLTYRNEIYNFENVVAERDILSSYIPMTLRENSEKIAAVVELYSDVTSLVESINTRLLRVFIGVFVALTMLYMVLFYILTKANVTLSENQSLSLSNHDKLRYLAYYDPLTRLPNKTRFLARLRRIVRNSSIEKKMSALLFIDLDHFKLINDGMGHDAGDELLKIVSRRLKYPLRKMDAVFRWGGDEFTVILDSVPNYNLIATLSERILKSLSEPIKLKRQEVVVTASIGISVFPNDSKCHEQLLKNADSAMYYAKGTGGNRYAFYNSQMNAKALERLSFETGLKRAVRNNEFAIYYQPKISGINGEVVGVEALLRWVHPEYGILSPASFISYMEENGMIKYIGEWVISNVCMQAKKWMDAGINSVRMSINISTVQFLNDNLVDQVRSIIREMEIDPGLIELEFKESAFLNKTAFSVREMNKLREVGVKLSIDDFGSGYSSLQNLKVFPVNYLKIGQSFVKSLEINAKDAEIARAISALAESLDMQLTAECVENEKQVEILKSCGCREFQGFLFSKPLPPENIPRIIESRNITNHSNLAAG